MSDLTTTLSGSQAGTREAPGRESPLNDFRSLVAGGWETVDPAIRARMDRLLTAAVPTVFEGEGCVRRSRLGWLFAQLSRVLGGPLVRNQGERVKTIVRVVPTENGLRCWHRLYQFPDGSMQLVETTKVVDPKLGFLDAVGAKGEGALAMQMNVWAESKSLHFSSSRYFLRFRYLTVRIPPFFTPGTLSAEHRDEGNGWFRYSLKFSHPLWGETFYQDGRFKMVDQ